MLVLSERLTANVQRLIDEYVGAVGAAAIVSRTGEVVFRSSHDDSACGLAPALSHVPSPSEIDVEPSVVNLPVSRERCSYGVALDQRHVLLVVTMPGVEPRAAATRMRNAARLLRRVLGGGGNVAMPGNSGGGGGAPALAGVPKMRS